MNEKLIKFIELCLLDGKLTDKERIVIYNKAEEFGVSKDECEVILEALLFQKGISSSNTPSMLLEEQEEIIELQKPVINVDHFKSVLEGREYTLKIEISSDEQSRFIDLNITSLDLFEVYLPDISLLLNDNYIPDFLFWDNIMNNLTPIDDGLNEILKFYGKNSYWRQTKSFSNGAVYEGVLKKGVPNGMGELRINANNADRIYGFKTKGADSIKLRGEFKNGVFIKGKIDIEWVDEKIEEYRNAELYDTDNDVWRYKGFGTNDFEGEYVDFKKHGNGMFTKENGDVVHGEWKNDVLIKTYKIVKKELLNFKKKLEEDYDWKYPKIEKKWYKAIKLIEDYSNKDPEIFKDSKIALKYLTALYNSRFIEDSITKKIDYSNLEKAYNIHDSLINKVDDKDLLYGILGEIFLLLGSGKKDVKILKDALNFFKKIPDFVKVDFVKNKIADVEQEKREVEKRENEIKLIGSHNVLGIEINDLFLKGKKAIVKYTNSGGSKKEIAYDDDSDTEIQIMVKDISSVISANYYYGGKVIVVTGRRKEESIISEKFYDKWDNNKNKEFADMLINLIIKAQKKHFK